MFEAGKPTSFLPEGAIRPITYDGDKTVGVEFKTEEEREAVKKICAALDSLDSKEKAAEYVRQLSRMSQAELNLFAESPELARIWFNPKLSQHQRKIQSLPYLQHFRRQSEEKRKELRKAEREIEHLEGKKACAEEAEGFLELEPVLEKNDCSRLHMLKQAMREDKVIIDEGQTLTGVVENQKWTCDFSRFHSFVVQHDWAKAFEGATDFDEGEVKLPFEDCIFEFRISGHTVAVFASQESSGVTRIFPFVQFGDWWIVGHEMVCLGDPTKAPFFEHAAKEIRAIAVALDAEVASHSIVRAPEKLNKIRENSGKIPLSDFHIVKLSHRERITNPANGSSGTKKRLHFRRGHWRHYAEFKSWVRWTLVGNPELGFVDKEYRL